MPSSKILINYDDLAPLAVAAVAVQFPNAEATDDGGGPYVGIKDPTLGGDPDAVVELFVVAPGDTYVADKAWKWQMQHDGKVEVSDLNVTAYPTHVASWARSVLAKWRDEAQAAAAPRVHTMSEGNVLRLVEMLTAAATSDRGVRVAWESGLKVKVGEGMWTPTLSRPEQ